MSSGSVKRVGPRGHVVTLAQHGITPGPRARVLSSADLEPHSRKELGHARVPYWVYPDDANYGADLRRIFEGPVWNYLCLLDSGDTWAMAPSMSTIRLAIA